MQFMKNVKSIYFSGIVFFLMLQVMSLQSHAMKMLPDNFDFKIFVALNDTTNVSVIEVKLGNASGGSNLLNYSFGYDQTGNLPTGTAYTRKQKNIQLTLGSFPVGVAM